MMAKKIELAERALKAGKSVKTAKSETIEMPAGQLTLSLLRHAKSSRDVADMADIDRPLSKRGDKNAATMGSWMAGSGLAPDLILCSPSQRTRQTLAHVLPHLSGSPVVEHPDELYLAGPLLLLKHLHAVKKRDTHVMIIGHNPGLHALALDLIAGGPVPRIAALGRKLPTSGLVVLQFDVARWQDVVAGTGTLISFTTPGDLD
jgi:phosphohistidine phosphatase